MKLLTQTQRHIDRIKQLMWEQTSSHPLGMPQYFGSINYKWAYDGDTLSKLEYGRRYKITEVRKTHRFINKLIRKTFGRDIPIWWFIERHADTIDDDGNPVKGRFHSHFLVGSIDDNAITDPSPYLMPLFYHEDESGIPINMRNVNVEQLKILLLDACIRQAKWVGKYPRALKIESVPNDEMERTYYYCMKRFTSSIDEMDTVIDWGNSSYYKP